MAGWRTILLALATSFTSFCLNLCHLLTVNVKLRKSLLAVISILDSEDRVSTPSENRLEGKCVDLPEECNPKAAEVEEDHVSNNPPKTEEINVSKLFSHFLQNRKQFAN